MESRKELAAEKKRCGSHNCTQSVLCTYCDLTGLDEETIKHAGNCFAAGMGNGEGTCGSIVGAGIVYGLAVRDQAKAVKGMRQIMEKFQERNGPLAVCSSTEQLILLDDEGSPSLFAPIMIATLSTCAQLERDNISFRLQSGRKRYIEKGGKLGRKVGSVKTAEQMKAEYREVISLLRKGYSIRDVAKLSGKGVSTVQRVKRLIKVQSSQ